MVNNLKKGWHILKISKPLQAMLSSAFVVIVYSVGTFAVFHAVNTNHSDGTPQPSPTLHPEISKSPKPSVTPSISVSPTPSSSISPSSTPKPSPSLTPKKSTKGNGQLDAGCMQRLNAGYIKYNSDLAAENKEHQAALALLQDNYDNGAYDDPYGNPDDNAYQSDVDDENAIWQNNTTVINQAWQTIQNANKC